MKRLFAFAAALTFTLMAGAQQMQPRHNLGFCINRKRSGHKLNAQNNANKCR